MLSAIEVFNEAVWHGTGAPATETRGAAEARETFIRGMLETPSQGAHRNPAEWAASLVLHIMIVAVVIVAPLYFTGTIDLGGFERTFLVAPRPPAAAPPPAQVEKVVKAIARPIPQQAITQPVIIPAKIRMVHDAAPPPNASTMGVIGGVPGGVVGGVLGGVIGGATNVPPPPPPSARPAHEILRVGGDVKPPQVLYAPAPVYPALARTSRVEGVVTLDAIIDETGHVVQARALSGPALLLHSALMAVSQWRYRPTYLDGQPVEIRMHVTVKFRLQ